jgi:hypothetical protein
MVQAYVSQLFNMLELAARACCSSLACLSDTCTLPGTQTAAACLNALFVERSRETPLLALAGIEVPHKGRRLVSMFGSGTMPECPVIA